MYHGVQQLYRSVPTSHNCPWGLPLAAWIILYWRSDSFTYGVTTVPNGVRSGNSCRSWTSLAYRYTTANRHWPAITVPRATVYDGLLSHVVRRCTAVGGR